MRFLPILLVGIVLFSGCAVTLQEVPFEEFELTCDAMAKEYVINSEAEFTEQILNNVPDPNLISCENYEFPRPDFSNKTLLGKGIQAGGCDVKFNKKIFVDNNNKKYIYNIDVEKIGSCEKLVFSNNWITVDKIPSDYAVVFQQN